MRAEQRFNIWRRIVGILLCLIALEGLVVIISLLAEPSQSGGFLGFSSGRWATLLLNALALFGLYRAWTDKTGRLEAWLAGERHLFWLLFLSLALFAFALPASAGWMPAIRGLVYFGRLQPSLMWLAFASGQAALTLLVVLRREIFRRAQRYIPSHAPERGSSPLTNTQRLVLLAIGIGYLALQLASHMQVRDARWTGDSIDYFHPATLGLANPGFWTSARPWGISFFYMLAGESLVGIDILQVAFSSITWLGLAGVFIASVRRPWVKVGSLMGILAFSLTPAIQHWNHIVLSESISISLMVLMLCVWLSLLQEWRWFKFLGLLLVITIWFHARETNAYLGMLIALGVFIFGWFKKRQRFYWLISIAAVIFFILNNHISEGLVMPRWVYPFVNVLLQRILPEPAYVQFFADQGMPVTPELLSYSGKYAFSDWFAIFNRVEFRKFERWLFSSGKWTYTYFLATHPAYTLFRPLQDIQATFATTLIGYSSERYSPILPGLVNEILYPVRWFWGYVCISLASVGAFIGAKIITRDTSRVFWGVFVFFILAYPHLLLAWHGDAMEISRHAVQANVQFRLAIVLLLLQGADFLAVRKGE